MSKWLNKFIDEALQNSTDKTDRFNSDANMSVLSVPLGGIFDKNLENMSETQTDITDRFNSGANMSVLSVPPEGIFGENLENVSKTRTDITDRFNPDANVSVLSVPSGGIFGKSSLLDDFEERLAIAEVDGHQSPLQAKRIAYVDAFIAAISTLPYEKIQEKNWFEKRVKNAQNWLIAQGLEQPE